MSEANEKDFQPRTPDCSGAIRQTVRLQTNTRIGLTDYDIVIKNIRALIENAGTNLVENTVVDVDENKFLYIGHLDDLETDLVGRFVRAVERSGGPSEEEVNELLRSLAELHSAPIRSPVVLDDGTEVLVDETGLPMSAPALWAERTSGREVTPVDFIKKYYGPWIDEGILDRAALRKLDEALYQAYASWIRKGRGHESDSNLVPKSVATYGDFDGTKMRSHARRVPISELGAEEAAERRAYEAFHGRRKRQKSRLG